MSEELDPRILGELREIFDDKGHGDKLNSEDLGEVFKALGDPQPNYKIRDIMKEFDKDNDGDLSFDEFCKMYAVSGTNKVWGSKLRQNISSRTGIQELKTHEKSAVGTVHSATDTERAAFARYFTIMLKDDPDLKSYLPIKPDNDDLFVKVSDGVIFCKMVNLAVPNTIDERTINKKKLNAFTKTENVNLALNSFSAIGICVVNVGSQDIINGVPHLVFGVTWQILKMVLLKNISIQYTPQLACLLEEGETIEMLMAKSPEEILIRWVNYHMKKADCNRVMTNYGSDLKDSEIYANLLERIIEFSHPIKHDEILAIKENKKRAEKIIENLENADLAFLMTADDIVKGNTRLNLALIAHLFNLYPCLEEVEDVEIIEETREEKLYRNWMNSLGVTPKVNYIYVDLNDGNILLQLLDIIKPGCVNWKKVNKSPYKKGREHLLKVENTNYAVEVAKSLKISLVGVSGTDIYEQQKKFVLSFVFQTMYMYTIAILESLTETGERVTDKKIIEWQNSISSVQINGFKDPSHQTSVPICRLIEAIQPGSINFDYLNDALTPEDKLKNAIYALSSARKIGAKMFILPEDIAEGVTKNISIAFACLYERHLKGN